MSWHRCWLEIASAWPTTRSATGSLSHDTVRVRAIALIVGWSSISHKHYCKTGNHHRPSHTFNPDIYCHVQYRKLGSTNTHRLQIPYEYIPIKTFAINYLKKKYPRKGKYPVNISTFTPIDLWAEFHWRVNVASCPRSSSSNTRAWASMVCLS